MNSRKGSVLTLGTLAVVLGLAGISLAAPRDDEKSKIHLAMEKVQKNNGIIVKNTKNAAAFKKGQKDVVDAAKALVKLGKETRDETDPAKENKKEQKAWTDLMDSFIKESEKFAEIAGKDDAKQPDVKKAFGAVSKTCADCHKDFRKED